MKDKQEEISKSNFQLRDIILGGQDGLVNVLGIILGLAVASKDLRIILAGGLAAAFAESVSMGAVAFTSTRAQQSFYESELAKEKRGIEEMPEFKKQEVTKLYLDKGFSGDLLNTVTEKIISNKQVWVDELMNSKRGIQQVEAKDALNSSFIVGISAMVGSLIPMLPFFFFSFLKISINQATLLSLLIAAAALFVVGAYKAKVTVGDWKKSGLEITVIGIVSALIGYLIGLFFKSPVG